MYSQQVEESFVYLNDDFDNFTNNISFENDGLPLIYPVHDSLSHFNEIFSSLKSEKTENSINYNNPESDIWEKNKKSTETKIGKKRGRQTEQENNNKKLHDKFKTDNQIRTIQVHYFNFIIKFLNTILNELNLNYFFLDLSYKYKQKTQKKHRKELEEKTIRDILLEAPISGKIKVKDENYNKNIIKKIDEEDKYLCSILDKKYLSFFETIYCTNLNKINLNLFNCIDKEINLYKKVNKFIDLIDNEDEKYKKKMEETAKKYFINNYNP